MLQKLRSLMTGIRTDGSIMVYAIMLVTGVIGLWVKFTQMDLNSGFLTISRFIGRSKASELTFLEHFSFFRADLPLQLIGLPLAGMLLLRLAPRQVRLPLAALLAIAICIGYYFELQALGSVGRYLSWHMATDAILWARYNPSSVSDYVTAGGVIKLLLASTAILLLAILGNRRNTNNKVGVTVRTIEWLTLATLPCTAVLTLLAFQAQLPIFPHHASAPASIMQALFEDDDTSRLGGRISQAALLDLYNTTTGRKTSTADDFPIGRDAGHDVLLFVMETGPEASWDSANLPSLATLRSQSFTSRQHYTTYPYTSDAIFSIITGMYPIGRRAFLRRDTPLMMAGLVPPLRHAGYEGTAYLPYPDTFEDDRAMYRLTGFATRYVATEADSSRHERALVRARQTALALPQSSATLQRDPAALHERLWRDFMILDKLKEDIVANKKAGRRFVALFMPQIGHAPWLDLRGRDKIVDRGGDIMAMQDAWIGEITALLRANNWLGSTIIVITADHGIRTRMEDPALESGMLSDYTFNVPLQVFAPATLSENYALRQLTSHIDITPTIHGLLGIATNEGASEGLPIWDNRRLAQRHTFFFGKEYMGVDGYKSPERFVMVQALTGAAYASGEFRFGPGSMLRQEAEQKQAADPIAMMYALQPRLLQALR